MHRCASPCIMLRIDIIYHWHVSIYAPYDILMNHYKLWYHISKYHISKYRCDPRRLVCNKSILFQYRYFHDISIFFKYRYFHNISILFKYQYFQNILIIFLQNRLLCRRYRHVINISTTGVDYPLLIPHWDPCRPTVRRNDSMGPGMELSPGGQPTDNSYL